MEECGYSNTLELLVHNVGCSIGNKTKQNKTKKKKTCCDWPDLFCFLFGLLTAVGNSEWLGNPFPVPFLSRQLSESLPLPIPSRLLDRDKDSGEPWEGKPKTINQEFGQPAEICATTLNIGYKTYHLLYMVRQIKALEHTYTERHCRVVCLTS